MAVKLAPWIALLLFFYIDTASCQWGLNFGWFWGNMEDLKSSKFETGIVKAEKVSPKKNLLVNINPHDSESESSSEENLDKEKIINKRKKTSWSKFRRRTKKYYRRKKLKKYGRRMLSRRQYRNKIEKIRNRYNKFVREKYNINPFQKTGNDDSNSESSTNIGNYDQSLKVTGTKNNNLQRHSMTQGSKKNISNDLQETEFEMESTDPPDDENGQSTMSTTTEIPTTTTQENELEMENLTPTTNSLYFGTQTESPLNSVANQNEETEQETPTQLAKESNNLGTQNTGEMYKEKVSTPSQLSKTASKETPSNYVGQHSSNQSELAQIVESVSKNTKISTEENFNNNKLYSEGKIVRPYNQIYSKYVKDKPSSSQWELAQTVGSVSKDAQFSTKGKSNNKMLTTESKMLPTSDRFASKYAKNKPSSPQSELAQIVDSVSQNGQVISKWNLNNKQSQTGGNSKSPLLNIVFPSQKTSISHGKVLKKEVERIQPQTVRIPKRMKSIQKGKIQTHANGIERYMHSKGIPLAHKNKYDNLLNIVIPGSATVQPKNDHYHFSQTMQHSDTFGHNVKKDSSINTPSKWTKSETIVESPDGVSTLKPFQNDKTGIENSVYPKGSLPVNENKAQHNALLNIVDPEAAIPKRTPEDKHAFENMQKGFHKINAIKTPTKLKQSVSEVYSPLDSIFTFDVIKPRPSSSLSHKPTKIEKIWTDVYKPTARNPLNKSNFNKGLNTAIRNSNEMVSSRVEKKFIPKPAKMMDQGFLSSRKDIVRDTPNNHAKDDSIPIKNKHAISGNDHIMWKKPLINDANTRLGKISLSHKSSVTPFVQEKRNVNKSVKDIRHSSNQHAYTKEKPVSHRNTVSSENDRAFFGKSVNKVQGISMKDNQMTSTNVENSFTKSNILETGNKFTKSSKLGGNGVASQLSHPFKTNIKYKITDNKQKQFPGVSKLSSRKFKEDRPVKSSMKFGHKNEGNINSAKASMVPRSDNSLFSIPNGVMYDQMILNDNKNGIKNTGTNYGTPDMQQKIFNKNRPMTNTYPSKGINSMNKINGNFGRTLGRFGYKSHDESIQAKHFNSLPDKYASFKLSELGKSDLPYMPHGYVNSPSIIKHIVIGPIKYKPKPGESRVSLKKVKSVRIPKTRMLGKGIVYPSMLNKNEVHLKIPDIPTRLTKDLGQGDITNSHHKSVPESALITNTTVKVVHTDPIFSYNSSSWKFKALNDSKNGTWSGVNKPKTSIIQEALILQNNSLNSKMIAPTYARTGYIKTSSENNVNGKSQDITKKIVLPNPLSRQTTLTSNPVENHKTNAVSLKNSLSNSIPNTEVTSIKTDQPKIRFKNDKNPNLNLRKSVEEVNTLYDSGVSKTFILAKSEKSKPKIELKEMKTTIFKKQKISPTNKQSRQMGGGRNIISEKKKELLNDIKLMSKGNLNDSNVKKVSQEDRKINDNNVGNIELHLKEGGSVNKKRTKFDIPKKAEFVHIQQNKKHNYTQSGRYNPNQDWPEHVTREKIKADVHHDKQSPKKSNMKSVDPVNKAHQFPLNPINNDLVQTNTLQRGQQQIQHKKKRQMGVQSKGNEYRRNHANRKSGKWVVIKNEYVSQSNTNPVQSHNQINQNNHTFQSVSKPVRVDRYETKSMHLSGNVAKQVHMSQNAPERVGESSPRPVHNAKRWKTQLQNKNSKQIDQKSENEVEAPTAQTSIPKTTKNNPQLPENEPNGPPYLPSNAKTSPNIVDQKSENELEKSSAIQKKSNITNNNETETEFENDNQLQNATTTIQKPEVEEEEYEYENEPQYGSYYYDYAMNSKVGKPMFGAAGDNLLAGYWKDAVREEAKEIAVEMEGVWKDVNATFINGGTCPRYRMRYRNNAVVVDTIKDACRIIITWNKRQQREKVQEKFWWGAKTYYNSKTVFVPVVTYVDLR